jgi:hypothetical protein
VTRLADGGWSWRITGSFERAFGGRVYELQVPAWEVDQVNDAAELDAAGDVGDADADADSDDSDLAPVGCGHNRASAVR